MSENQNEKITSEIFRKTDGYIELPSKPYEVKNTRNMLVISDLHIPFHSKKAIEKSLEFRDEVDTILILGDALDFYSLSSFAKIPDKYLLVEELKLCKSFIAYLKEKFPKARIIFYEGNHEQRFDRYIILNAPALFGIESMNLENFLGLKSQGVEFVRNGVIIKAGELYFIHGNEAGIKGGINISRTMLLRAYDNIIFGNFHKTQISSGKSIAGKEFASFAIGCLCQLKPNYMPVNEWNWGFAFVEFYKKEFEVYNKRILLNGHIR